MVVVVAAGRGESAAADEEALSRVVVVVVVGGPGEVEEVAVEEGEGEGEPRPGPSTSRPSLSRHCTVYLLTAFTSVSPTLALSADTPVPFRASLSPSRGLASPVPGACTLKARSGPGGRAESLGAGALWGEKLWARCTPVFLPADTRTALMMSECCGSDSFLKVRRVVTGGGAASAGGSVAGDTARHKGVNGSHEQLGMNELMTFSRRLGHGTNELMTFSRRLGHGTNELMTLRSSWGRGMNELMAFSTIWGHGS